MNENSTSAAPNAGRYTGVAVRRENSACPTSKEVRRRSWAVGLLIVRCDDVESPIAHGGKVSVSAEGMKAVVRHGKEYARYVYTSGGRSNS
jgi:hypothetical protein